MNKDDWFDDPEWLELRRKVNKQPKQKQPKRQDSGAVANTLPSEDSALDTKEAPKKVEVKLNITLPHLSKYKKKIKGFFREILNLPRKITVSLAALAVLLVLVAGINKLNNKQDVSSDTGGAATGTAANAVKPEFNSLVPEGKDSDFEASKVRYDSEKKVASFEDTIIGVGITLSQQQLPENFKSDPEAEVQKIAENFGAREVIYAGEVKAFSGVSAKGPQTVIFSKHDLLIFIKSNEKLDKDGLIQYIIDLKK